MRLRSQALILTLFFSLVSFSTDHKFYVSVTHINYSEKEETLQVTTRVFIDDLEAVLLERYGAKTDLATQREAADADAYIGKYLQRKMVFTVDGSVIPLTFLGKEYETDIAICYIEVPVGPLEGIDRIEIQNEVLMDLFEEQQNVVHFRIDGKRRSYVLLRENNKGMLNL